MELSESNIIGFIASTDLDAASAFYIDKLGLKLISSDEYALEFKINNTTLRIIKVKDVARTEYTVLGWEVGEIISTVTDLDKNGIEFIFYEGMSQDELGICTFPNGGKVAWFKDPDGNTLSITQS